MPYEITSLSNSNPQGIPFTAPTILIKKGDKEWNKAFENWLKGKPPTDSPEWKKGIFAATIEI